MRIIDRPHQVIPLISCFLICYQAASNWTRMKGFWRTFDLLVDISAISSSSPKRRANVAIQGHPKLPIQVRVSRTISRLLSRSLGRNLIDNILICYLSIEAASIYISEKREHDLISNGVWLCV